MNWLNIQKMKRIFDVRPGITSLATLHLRDEEKILANVSDPERHYNDVLVPLKVKISMEHVEWNSFAFDLRVLCQTIWMLTFGQLWPIKEHPVVTELREKINMVYKARDEYSN